jgi:hypothetical protein
VPPTPDISLHYANCRDGPKATELRCSHALVRSPHRPVPARQQRGAGSRGNYSKGELPARRRRARRAPPRNTAQPRRAILRSSPMLGKYGELQLYQPPAFAGFPLCPCDCHTVCQIGSTADERFAARMALSRRFIQLASAAEQIRPWLAQDQERQRPKARAQSLTAR